MGEKAGNDLLYKESIELLKCGMWSSVRRCSAWIFYDSVRRGSSTIPTLSAFQPKNAIFDDRFAH